MNGELKTPRGGGRRDRGSRGGGGGGGGGGNVQKERRRPSPYSSSDRNNNSRSRRQQAQAAAEYDDDDNDNDDDDDDDDDISEVTILIDHTYFGALIGHGGSTIRRLQWQTHTTIKCSSADDQYPGTTSRKMTLVSSSAAAMDAAQSMALLQVAQNYPETFREVGVVIPDELAGRVIGKGGDHINLLRQNLESCSLLPPRSDGSKERLLTIRGSVTQLTASLRSIIDSLLTPIPSF